MGTQNLEKVPMGTRVTKWGPTWPQWLSGRTMTEHCLWHWVKAALSITNTPTTSIIVHAATKTTTILFELHNVHFLSNWVKAVPNTHAFHSCTQCSGRRLCTHVSSGKMLKAMEDIFQSKYICTGCPKKMSHSDFSHTKSLLQKLDKIVRMYS